MNEWHDEVAKRWCKMAKSKVVMRLTRISDPVCLHFEILRDISIRELILPILTTDDDGKSLNTSSLSLISDNLSHDEIEKRKRRAQRALAQKQHVHSFTFWSKHDPYLEACSIIVQACYSCEDSNKNTVFNGQTSRKRKRTDDVDDFTQLQSLISKLSGNCSAPDTLANLPCDNNGRRVFTWSFKFMPWSWLVYVTKCVRLYDVIVRHASHKVDFLFQRDGDTDSLVCSPTF